jgi:Xaa-Pro aminopeptidase
LKIGIKYKDIEQQTRTSLGKYSSYFIHSLGHGLGVEIHEPLDVKLKRNQVFTVEPGVYFKEFGLRIEDTILMQEKPLILTKTSKNLLVIPKII